MQFIQKAIDFFLTNMDWLFSGLLVPIVFYKWMFKNVHGFIDFLYDLTQNYKRVRVYAFKCTKEPPILFKNFIEVI